MCKLETKFEMVIWTAHTLFNKGLVTGSTGNISFIDKNKMYITKSGECFGRIEQNSFAVVDLEGNILNGIPSKEYIIHLAIYQNNSQIKSVIHTHSLNSTIYSSLKDVDERINDLFLVTPYLQILTNGKINCVEYASPGSKELFDEFKNKVDSKVKIYLLKNHGIVVAEKNIYDAFNLLEEFEASAMIQLKINNYEKKDFNVIKY